jgi:hypothetical protein
MSPSSLYHAFGLRTFEYIKTEYHNDATPFLVKKKETARCCSNCESCEVSLAGRVESIWHCLPVGVQAGIIAGYLPPELVCRERLCNPFFMNSITSNLT